jgi:hypothetical protein
MTEAFAGDDAGGPPPGGRGFVRAHRGEPAKDVARDRRRKRGTVRLDRGYPRIAGRPRRLELSAANPDASGHDHHGAVRVMHDLAADRSRHEPGEPARPARSHDQKVSLAGSLDELLGRETVDRTNRH